MPCDGEGHITVLMCLGWAALKKQDACLQKVREPFAQLHSLPLGQGCSSSKARLELWVRVPGTLCSGCTVLLKITPTKSLRLSCPCWCCA